MLNSTFDTLDLVSYEGSFPNYVSGIITFVVLMSSSKWVCRGSFSMKFDMLMKFVFRSYWSGMSLLLSVYLFFVMMGNLFGMIPLMIPFTSYSFSGLTMSFIFWLMVVVAGWSRGPSLSSYTPKGGDMGLSPFLALVEVTSSLIRPLTLGLRLLVNVTTGHVILTLFSYVFSVMGVLGGVLYSMFESVVCVVQAFVLVMLCSMYANDYLPVLMVSKGADALVTQKRGSSKFFPRGTAIVKKLFRPLSVKVGFSQLLALAFGFWMQFWLRVALSSPNSHLSFHSKLKVWGYKLVDFYLTLVSRLKISIKKASEHYLVGQFKVYYRRLAGQLSVVSRQLLGWLSSLVEPFKCFMSWIRCRLNMWKCQWIGFKTKVRVQYQMGAFSYKSLSDKLKKVLRLKKCGS